MDTINGGPTKRFFVSMLTKDIELSDSILDLIDNCVDGAIRSSESKMDEFSVFEGFVARLNISRESFQIRDNCGGIPEKYIEDSFLLGRPSIDKDGDLPTIGMFGIGMKRAIFKMGSDALVSSNSKEKKFTVHYDKDWLAPHNEDWGLPINSGEPDQSTEFGVTIDVSDLKPEIQEQFGSEGYVNKLKSKISEYYGYIMQRGFAVYVNDELLKPKTVPVMSQLMFKPDEDSLQPFDFVANIDGVEVKVIVGFYRPLIMDEEIDQETQEPDRENKGGISVICNDRVVVLHDKTILTGWGDAGAARFHPQFRAIAGLIDLSSNNAELLPLSTTKRGLDPTSKVFFEARQQCIDGIKTFTSFTNRWKGNEREASELFKLSKRTDARTEVSLAKEAGTAVRSVPGAKRFRPRLPMPKQKEPNLRVTFFKPRSEVDKLAKHFFETTDAKPSLVGEEAFDRALKESDNAKR